MKFIDVHTHVSDSAFIDSKEEVLSDFFAACGGALIDAGCDERSSALAAQNAEAHERVFFTAGVHPEYAEGYSELTERAISRLAESKKCAAIGEIGLDRHYSLRDEKAQLIAFERQICLADELGLPFVVHSRDASMEMLSALTRLSARIKRGFLMHCYSESAEQAKRYADLGGYFSFGGVITFKNAAKDKILRSVPRDRLLFETDAPYLAPEPKRGTLNKPENVRYVYEKAAAILETSVEELCSAAAKNAVRLFPALKSVEEELV